MRSTLPLLAALALSACVTSPVEEGPIPRDGEYVRLHQPARIGPLTVTPHAVLEDSRCPINVRCVWAGRAVVRTEVAGRGWRETLNLTLGERAAIHGMALALTAVEPGKMAGVEMRPADYRFAFEAR